MTDHLIQRRPLSGNLLAEFHERPPEEYHREVVPYYPSPLPSTPANALYSAVAQVAMDNNSGAGLPVLAREIARQKPKEAEFYIVLGDGLLTAGKHRDAVAAYEQAVRLKPDSVSFLRSLAAAYTTNKENARATAALDRALRIAPADPIAWYNYGMLDLVPAAPPTRRSRSAKQSRSILTFPASRATSARSCSASGNSIKLRLR